MLSSSARPDFDTRATWFVLIERHADGGVAVRTRRPRKLGLGNVTEFPKWTDAVDLCGSVSEAYGVACKVVNDLSAQHVDVFHNLDAFADVVKGEAGAEL